MTRASLLLKVFLIGLAAMAPCVASAQTGDGRITGQVVSEADGPLKGATVAVQNPADSTLVTGVVTDSTGAFSIGGLDDDVYDVRVSFVGYTATRVTDVRLTRSRPVRDLGTIRLSAETSTLGEVTVSAERPAVEVQTDRTVYNTQQQIVTAGGSARTVLSDLPSIEVDLDGSISLRGSEGVVVHVNGEPTSLSGQSLASFLQSLPASAVERVEVIPNPSAKEEPEGASGIINIVLKRNRSAGWSGGATAGAGTNDAYNASGNVGYQSGDWRFFANYGYRRGSEDEGGSRFRRNFTSDPVTVLDQSSTETERERSHTLNAQTEYRPTKATSVTVETVLSTETEFQDARTGYVRETNGGMLVDRYARLNDAESGEQSLDTRASVKHSFGTDHVLTAKLRYEREWESEDALYTERSMDARRSLGAIQERERDDLDETEEEGTLELDYTRPLGDVTLETGYQGELRTQISDQVFEAFDTSTEAFRTRSTSRFDYDDQTHAVYGQLTVPLTNQWRVKGGVRAEHTFRTFTLPTRDASFDKRYFNVFPSVFLTYNRDDRYLARLSYSKRMRRPDTWQLDPVDDNEDPTFRFQGNPQLDPEYVHSFELSLTRQWDLASLSVTPFFRRSVNEIERREDLGPDGVTVLTFDNFASSNSYGVEVVTSLQMDDWVRGNVSFNANRVVTDASNVDTDLSNDAMAYSGRANLTFGVGPGLDLQVSQYYSAPRDIAGGTIGGRASSDVALKKDLFDGDANLSLRVSDVFDGTAFDVERRTDAFYTESRRIRDQRQIMMTFSYSFGSSDARQSRRGR